MLNILSCDDEKEFLIIIKKILDEYLTIPYSLYATHNTGIMEEYLEKNSEHIDVLLMDIELQEHNGIEIASQIIKRWHHIKVIFITGYVEQYFESLFLQLRPFAVLHKPIKPELLCQLLNKAYLERDYSSTKYLTLKSQSGVLKLEVDQIIFIESVKRKVQVHLAGEIFSCYNTLNQIMTLLPHNFIRCHKSFLVNMDYIKNFNSVEITLMDGTSISVSKSKAIKAKTQYFTYIGMGI